LSIDDVLSGKAQFAVVCGDATAVMATLPDECVGVSYFDPPYGLSAQSTENIVECLTAWLAGKVYTHKSSGFMGSSWDAFTPGPEVFREVHRALRPGGYCVAFSSTRTVDLLGIAVRLAGFEIRPGLAWAFGSGFPKSLDVSRSIDSHEGMEREIVAPNPNARPNRAGTLSPSMNSQSEGLPITVPPHPAAVQWDGYGTDVKPAFEPLIVARKALDGTVAGNVQKHGCGALNIDAARIGSESTQRSVNIHGVLQHGGQNHRPSHDATPVHRTTGSTLGRFPAALALVHDEGCVCEGTRRVRGDARTGGGVRPGGFGNVGAERGSGGPCAPGHADPDGTESVDAWTCTDTCAVAELGRQSGSSGNVTVPSSPAAVQWDGYGTDVKPAFEPLVVARKALDGTVAHNVQKHGCGALNIDGARIGSAGGTRKGTFPNGASNGVYGDGLNGACEIVSTGKGRFPAALALVHDEGCVCEGTTTVRRNIVEGTRESPSVATYGEGVNGSRSLGQTDESVDAWTCTPTCAVAELGRQSGELTSGQPSGVQNVQSATYGQSRPGREVTGFGDTGTAARFFYQAKASASDRLAYITCTAGCARHESVAFQKDARDSARDPSREQPHGFCRACNGVRTHYGHPTVKPLALAAYHARLLSLPPHTRPIALVPFCGTGIEARALLDVGFRVIAIDLDPRHCAMTTFRLTHKEPEHVTEERAAVTEAERGDWTKPIRVSEVAVKAPVPSVRKEQLPLFGAK
jgi:DNA modification methylase